MSRKILTITLGVYLSMFFAGCAQQADLSLRPNVGDISNYAYASRTLVDYKFEQPSLGKLDEKQTGSTLRVTYEQEVISTDEEGATAKITIKSLKYEIKDRNGIKLDVDTEKGKAGPLAKLIGHSYTIKLLPDGSVKVVDANAIRKIVRGSYEGRVATAFLSDDRLILRHQILALPGVSETLVNKDDVWNKVVDSHPGLRWAPKSFSKTYTLTDVSTQGQNQIAHIAMDATESTQEGKPKVGLNPFASLFDPDESYTGELIVNLSTGTVIKYNEKFAGKYIAQEMPRNGDEAKGPDTLMMGFTNSISLEKID